MDKKALFWILKRSSISLNTGQNVQKLLILAISASFLWGNLTAITPSMVAVEPSGLTHWAFMMAISVWEATFSYKSYGPGVYSYSKEKLKAIFIKPIFQTGISCISVAKINGLIIQPICDHKTADSYSCNHAEWGFGQKWTSGPIR